MKQLKADLLLMLAAIIWGSSFVAQSVGGSILGPFAFNGIRFIIGSIVLLPVIFVTDKLHVVEIKPAAAGDKLSHILGTPGTRKRLILSSIICGIILAIASSLQQVGILYTTPGKSGFITALYVILVPIFSLLRGRRSGSILWLSVLLAIAGLYFLCLSGEVTINIGDVLTFICAFFFALHIMAIDTLAPDVNGLKLSCIQFFTAGVICLIIMAFTEDLEISAIYDAIIPLLYAGGLSCSVAYTLQVVAQKMTSPVLASLILSLESVFSVISAWLILGNALSGREILGCVIMFAAIVLAQLPIGKKAVVN